jgi:pimeloyl-ACP methyl ester carboxylesterase
MNLVVAGARTYVKTTGEGSPVLFLHGNPDTSDVWEAVADRLARQHRCFAPDLPAFGRSESPASFDASLDGLATWVDRLVAALDLTRPVDLVVHDFGGLFGIAWAVRYPDKVRRLAILNTVFFPDYRWHFWARVWRTPMLGELSFALNSRLGMRLEMRRGSKRLPAGYADRAYANMTRPMTRMVLQLYRATDPTAFAPWQDGLRALAERTPLIVLWGDRDPYIGPAFADRFGAREVHHFADAGHWLQLEEPDAVAAHLLGFFIRT